MALPQRASKKWLRILRLTGFAIGLVIVAYLADTVGEATLRITGTVVDSTAVWRPHESLTGTRTEETHYVKIAVPGRTFWYSGPYRVGETVSVRVTDGRFTKWRYVAAVDPPRLAEFNEALQEYNATVSKLKEEWHVHPVPSTTGSAP